MRAIIIAGGDKMSKSSVSYIETGDFVICADRGLNYAYENEIRPNLIVGDMDSVSLDILKMYDDVEQIKFKAEKDFSDSELAIKIAVERGYNDIIMFSAIGTRIDHSLANIMMIGKYYEEGVEISIINEYSEICILKENNVFKEFNYDFFTIIPLSRKLEGLDIFNAKYELRNKTVNFGDTLCVSNETLNNELRISKQKGNAILILTNEI